MARAGLIYVMEAGEGRLKVGYTKALQARSKSLGGLKIIFETPWMDTAESVEKAAHRLLDYRFGCLGNETYEINLTDALDAISAALDAVEKGSDLGIPAITEGCVPAELLAEADKNAHIRQAAAAKKPDGPGRPKEHHYTDADCQIIQAAWHGSPVKNPTGRTAAVNALTGEDGKPRFPKFKQSTWYTLKNAGRVK